MTLLLPLLASPEIILFLKDSILPLLIGLAAWHKDLIKNKLGIKKAEADIGKVTAENIQSNFNLYQSLLDDLEVRYKRQLAEIESTFKADIQELKQVIENLESTLNSYKEQFGNLKK